VCIASRNRDDGIRSADEGVRVGAEPPEQICSLRGAAVMDRDACGDPDRCRPFGCIVGSQEFVGQPTSRRTVTSHCQCVGQAGGDCGRSRFGCGPVKSCRPGGLVSAARSEVGQRVSKSIVLQAVFSHPQREIR
jgi:hypothetical protein